MSNYVVQDSVDERDLNRVVMATYIFAGLVMLGVLGSVIQLVAGLCGFLAYYSATTLFFNLLGIASGGLYAYANVRSARAIAAREDGHLSFFVAGINCFAFPLGTMLSMYSWHVLARPSVRELYSNPDARALASPSPASKPKKPRLVAAPDDEMSFQEALNHLEHADDAEEQMWKKLEDDHNQAGSKTASTGEESSS
jgi:hypothetical protein